VLVIVNVTTPESVGVIVKVWGAAELEKLRTTGVVNPPPEGVSVIAPVTATPGVTVKLVDAELTLPEPGPVKVAVR